MRGELVPRKTVLIVDDDADLRRAVRVICELQSLEVIQEASDGKEAIQFAESLQPDFVILDYLMPNLDGELAAGVIRALAPASKIIAFSAILEEQPPWADAFLMKNAIDELPNLLAKMDR
jgi:CheY-like chemotaxis protein